MFHTDVPLQLLGTVDTRNGQAQIMLCRDNDCPSEAMIQWHGPEIKGGGALVEVSTLRRGVFQFKPKLFYELDSGGGLYAPSHIPNVQLLLQCAAELKQESGKLVGTWSDFDGWTGALQFNLPLTAERVRAKKLRSWTEFKFWAGQQRLKGEFESFRGHGSNEFPLSSTLHRSGRARSERFCYETIPRFRALAEATLDLRFQNGDADDFSVVLGLAQHHGLPTPLLDLTASPYVAAFFAFSDALENMQTRTEHTHVRIFALSREVSQFAPAHIAITSPGPNISFLSISPRKNPRLLAQQGRFLFSNIVDLEGALCSIGKKLNKKLITAVDIPIKFAIEALEDLSFMGLSGATMFPGLDGVCRMMKHEMAYKKGQMHSAPFAEAPSEQLGSRGDQKAKDVQ